MKTLGLTTWERIALLRIIPPQSRTITELRQNLRLAALLEMVEEEREKINWRLESDRFAWDQADIEWEINFEDADYDHMIRLATQFQAWPTQQETEILAGKLGLE